MKHFCFLAGAALIVAMPAHAQDTMGTAPAGDATMPADPAAPPADASQVPTDQGMTAPPADGMATPPAGGMTAPPADAGAMAPPAAAAPAADIQAQWAQYDKDSKGYLNPLEFGNWIMARQGQDMTATVEKSRTSKKANLPAIKVLNATSAEFSKADGDKNRQVSQQELAAYLAM